MDGSPLTVEVPTAEYKLFVRKGVPRFYLRNTNEGIYLSPKGVGWFIDGTSYTRDWSEIAAVNLVVGHIPKNGSIGTCRIIFTDDTVLSVLSASKWGHSDDGRNAEYGRFLHDFHRAIPSQYRSAIKFGTGAGKVHHVAMTVVPSRCRCALRRPAARPCSIFPRFSGASDRRGRSRVHLSPLQKRRSGLSGLIQS
jgi:hypothetical protein